ncbi:hypothetical protein [Anaerobaca lacustris]|uniref:Phenylacetate--CoA ligase family protein n=1 Tax=Anaerobaca lacustris TaxID=3044600 RepID=A0AAW6TV73_9BACT|nr:hypothetical protein [Sedimentisphaerales bacterium M17dextr]
MKFHSLRRLYEDTPAALKHLVHCVPYAWLAGRHYRRAFELCRKLDSMKRDEIRAFQEDELGRLLQYAVSEVPFYYRYRGLVHRHAPFEALKGFPLIQKSDVQDRFEQFTSRVAGSVPHHTATTGGSTGNQLTFLEDDSTYAKEMGFGHSQWARVGYAPRFRKATFRGVTFRHVDDSHYWQHNPIHNELQFSPFHMTEERLPAYLKRYIAYRPSFIHGYPSAVDILAEYVIRHDLERRLPPTRAAFLGSEACSELQRERIERAFGTRVYTWYGHSERVVMGGECTRSLCYHAIPAYGVLEIVDADGNSCDVGECGEIVGTGFLNRAMPLIRYRTDDSATREVFTCACGRQWDRFSNVMGRWSSEGYLIGKSGARISAAALNMHGDLFKNVIRYQYYQRVPGKLVIRVIGNALYSPEDAQAIVQQHSRKLWGEIDVDVVRVADIPLTISGKQRRIVSEVRF